MSENSATTEGAASEEGITATKKELLSDEAMFALFIIGLQMLAIWCFVTYAGWYIESEQLQDEYILEQGQELGYNWTEHNMTVFETTTSTGTFSSAPMHEVMCSNGVEEGCDYMIAADTADNLYGLTFAQWLVGNIWVPVQLVLTMIYAVIIFVVIARYLDP